MSSDSQTRLTFLVEALDLLSNTTVLSVFYGIGFSIYCLCARLLYVQLQEPDKRQQAKFTLGHLSIVFACTTALLIVDSRMPQLAYVNHADFPGGPFQYELSYSPTPESYSVANAIFDLIIKVLTMAIQVWRLWVVWGGTQYAIAVSILPLVLLLSYVGLQILDHVVASLVSLDQLGISDVVWTKIGTTTYAVLSTFTILVTGLVTARLLLFRRRQIKLMGISDTSRTYVSISAILIESYAVESAWSIASAIANGLNSPGSILLIDIDPIVRVLAYFLVVYRGASGRAWTRDTERKLTSLHFDQGAKTTIDEASCVHSQVRTTTSDAINSPSISRSELAV